MMLVCEGCGLQRVASASDPYPFACHAAGDGGDHVLVPVHVLPPFEDGPGDPFVVHRRWLSTHALAVPHLGDAAFVGIVAGLGARLADVDGVGFTPTPLRFVDALGVWVKDETHQVAGSHKARHLMGIALYLEVVRALGWVDAMPRLAIASCGNAALAAAVVARAAGWPLDVYVPTTADPAVLARLDALGATVHACPRRPDERGDPAWLRFQEALGDGALPFCVQGPANGLTLEGGQTLAWEMGAALRAQGAHIDHLVVQVGGGALASACVRGFTQLAAAGVVPMPRIHAVQTDGCFPLRQAWERARDRAAEIGVEPALREAAQRRGDYMAPWPSTPRSLAHGLLDDETYDWHHVVAGLLRTGGEVRVVDDAALIDARSRAHAAGFAVSHTGAAGLAGALARRLDGQVAVLLTGRG